MDGQYTSFEFQKVHKNDNLEIRELKYQYGIYSYGIFFVFCKTFPVSQFSISIFKNEVYLNLHLYLAPLRDSTYRLWLSIHYYSYLKVESQGGVIKKDLNVSMVWISRKSLKLRNLSNSWCNQFHFQANRATLFELYWTPCTKRCQNYNCNFKSRANITIGIVNKLC